MVSTHGSNVNQIPLPASLRRYIRVSNLNNILPKFLRVKSILKTALMVASPVLEFQDQDFSGTSITLFYVQAKPKKSKE